MCMYRTWISLLLGLGFFHTSELLLSPLIMEFPEFGLVLVLHTFASKITFFFFFFPEAFLLRQWEAVTKLNSFG